MMKATLVIMFGLGLALTVHAADGRPKAKRQKTAANHKAAASGAAADKGHLQTDVNFGDSVLRGEYQAPGEALAKVENEKRLRDLIGVRKHFKDRLAISQDQE